MAEHDVRRVHELRFRVGQAAVGVTLLDLQLAKAWFAVHRGPACAIAMTGAGLALAPFASINVPTWTTGTPVPLWALTPGIISMLAATGVENRLSQLSAGRSSRLVGARLTWLLAVATMSALASSLVALAIDQPLLPFVTVVLTVFSFGLSALAGRAAIYLGGVVVAIAVTFGGQVPSPDPLRWSLGEVGRAGIAGVALFVTVSLGTYAMMGSRVRTFDDSPR